MNKQVYPTYSIYALAHPEGNKVRYIGMSKDPEQRYKQHLSRKTGWIQELLEQGIKPSLIILEADLVLGKAKIREQYWITEYESQGHPLENIVYNEAATRQRDEEAQLQARLEEQYAYLPPEQAAHVIEITKGAYEHVGVCAWEDAFSVALFTAKHLFQDGKLKHPVDAVEIAILTLKRWNLRWRSEDTYIGKWK